MVIDGNVVSNFIGKQSISQEDIASLLRVQQRSFELGVRERGRVVHIGLTKTCYFRIQPQQRFWNKPRHDHKARFWTLSVTTTNEPKGRYCFRTPSYMIKVPPNGYQRATTDNIIPTNH